MERRPVADTPLAEWLNDAMANWRDPDTKVAGLSQNRLKEKTELAQSSIWGILKGGHTPKPDTIITLARFFGESPGALLRMAYLSEEEDTNLVPEASKKLGDLERVLDTVPQEAQLEVAEILLSQAQKLSAEKGGKTLSPARMVLQ
jgi:transcriptional regulator with XRE-family HTH domain